MYCIKCGVELSEGEKKCPLCGMTVYHPEIKNESNNRPYPSFDRPTEKVNRIGLMFVLTVLFSLPFFITLISDLLSSGTITWSGFAAGAILTAYITVLLPIWFAKPNFVIFIPADFAAVALYLLYVNYAVGGHWFLTFALPVTCALAFIATAVVTLLQYLKKGYLYVLGGLFISIGAFCVLLEFLLDITFDINTGFIWSIIPLVACVIVGMMLIVIAICKPIRESLHKKFFI